MGLPCTHLLKCSALVENRTNSCYRNSKNIITALTLTKKIYIFFFHAQVIQNCTTLSRIDIDNMDGKQQDIKQRKQKPGKCPVMMFCNKTNADGVRLYQFHQTLVAGQYIWLLPTIVQLQHPPNFNF